MVLVKEAPYCNKVSASTHYVLPVLLLQYIKNSTGLLAFIIEIKIALYLFIYFKQYFLTITKNFKKKVYFTF